MEVSQTVSIDRALFTHYVEFGWRPALFIPGQFDASIVGGVCPLIVRGSSLGTIEAQVRVFFYPSGVIDPFVPEIAVSLTLDHVALFGLSNNALNAESSKYREFAVTLRPGGYS